MNILSDQFRDSPAYRVFYYFEQLCAIPHGSGNTKAVSDFCVRFAEEKRLFCRQDTDGNVILLREASAGYEKCEPVIIQGHLDMVCEKEADIAIDFEHEPITIYKDGDFIKAKGTTLGADDGIAVASALALLEKKDLKAPRLEAVFTVDEETGMGGAKALDASILKGRRMLNLDSEEEGIFLCGCAGGLCSDISFPFRRETESGIYCRIRADGLTGGHSGTEIGKGHANAVKLIGRTLHCLRGEIPFSLIAADGGKKDNAIPRECTAQILLKPEGGSETADSAAARVKKIVSELEQKFCAEFHAAEPELFIEAKFPDGLRQKNIPVIPDETARHAEQFLFLVPNEMQTMSTDIPGLTESSLNAGILKTDSSIEGCISLTVSIRSSVSAKKELLAQQLRMLAGLLGAEYAEHGSYPAWEYQPDSKLRRQLVSLYENMYGKTPSVEIIHAGLECGLFQEKISGLDCVSFGPDIFDIHTPKERLSISSTERLWRFLLRFLSGEE